VDEPLETDLAGWPLALHQLPEPERSAITLFYLEIFSPPVLSEILGLTIEELARLIGAARKSLESQQTKSTAT
jgi:DNA-directed RNA polymerase specialized sigma24 family protein